MADFAKDDIVECVKWGPFLTVGFRYVVVEEATVSGFLTVSPECNRKWNLFGPKESYFKKVPA
jgi:hypothetical protein